MSVSLSREPSVTARLAFCMKRLLIILILFSPTLPTWAKEQTLLARITVYWPSGSEPQVASYNGAKLHGGHCAVDPKKIPYGSQVVFPDATCVAVDSGPAVISRLAARKAGRTPEQRNALVIDRYFASRKQALAWAAVNPHFMQVRVMGPHTVDKISLAKSESATGPNFAPKSPTTMHTQTDNVAPPPDVRGSLIPTVFGVSLPRS